MAKEYRLKKGYAAALIKDLIKIDVTEMINETDDLPQWQKDALDKELVAIKDDPHYTIPWSSVSNQFLHTSNPKKY